MAGIPRAVLIAWAACLGGCVEEVPVEGRPCPCDEVTHTCCTINNACVSLTQRCQEPDPTAPLLPLETGARWIYDVTTPTSRGRKVQTVLGEEPVPTPPGGDFAHRALRVQTRLSQDDAVEVNESWQERLGPRVVRHYERAFDKRMRLGRQEWWMPARLRVDESPERQLPLARWTDVYNETRLESDGKAELWVDRRDTWTALGEDIVQVPAGVFRCVKFTRERRTYWFAHGVGKVKEVNRGAETEELVEYHPP